LSIRWCGYRSRMERSNEVGGAGMAAHFPLGRHGRAFASRERGRELRELAQTRALDNDTLVIDFSDVTNVTYSFADEFVGRLSSESSLLVQCENMAAAVAGPVRRAVERRTGQTLVC
jgi:hypothetical protein